MSLSQVYLCFLVNGHTETVSQLKSEQALVLTRYIAIYSVAYFQLDRRFCVIEAWAQTYIIITSIL